MKLILPFVTTLLIISVFTSVTYGQVIDAHYDAPTMDRWNYPFNGSPGSRLSASTFGVVLNPGFDDHDAQFVIGFETLNDIQVGLDQSDYQILSATITITNTNGDAFRYDPTYDSHDTYLFLDDSLDPDPGRPIQLWAMGYRNGFDQTTWGEFTAFGGAPTVEPVQESRHAFAAYFPTDQTPVDISNNIKQGFDPTPLSIATTDAAAPGELVPADSTFTFEIDLCDPNTQAYLANGLSLGEARFTITSLQPADGGVGGGNGDINYPFWYTRENALAQILGYAPTLDIRVRVGSAADYNGDGSLNFFDVSAFLSDLGDGNMDADLNNDCTLNFFDISAFLAAFSG